MRVPLFLLCMVLLAVAGCRTHKIDPNINWNDRLGTYTYEQAIAELGRPDVIAESSEGKTAEWILRRSPAVSFGVGVGTGVYHGGGVTTGVGVGTRTTPIPRGDYLQLRFGPDGVLKGWTRMRR